MIWLRDPGRFASKGIQILCSMEGVLSLITNIQEIKENQKSGEKTEWTWRMADACHILVVSPISPIEIPLLDNVFSMFIGFHMRNRQYAYHAYPIIKFSPVTQNLLIQPVPAHIALLAIQAFKNHELIRELEKFASHKHAWIHPNDAESVLSSVLMVLSETYIVPHEEVAEHG